MSKIAFFLPTRRGSQRVKFKNTRPFAGLEGGLLELKLSQLVRVKGVDTIILSTNDPKSVEIASKFKDRGKELIIVDRPEDLASDSTLVEDFINYIPSIVHHDHIFWTHVTAPFVDHEVYEAALEKYFEVIGQEWDSLLSVTRYQQFLWSDKDRDIVNCDRSENKWPNTQDLDPLFEINHAFYISSRENYLNFSDRIGEHPYLFELDKVESVDIDTEEEFKIAEAIFSTGHRRETDNGIDFNPDGPLSCFLPCRKGSQRVKNKNIRKFAEFDKGLLQLKLDQLLGVKQFDEIILSTNDQEIIDYGSSLKDSRLRIDHRRDELCRSDTSTDDLIEYVPELVSKGHVLWTHVTSPFINMEDYEQAIARYRNALSRGYDSLMSVSRIQKFIFQEDAHAVNFNRGIEKWPRTQTIKPLFESNSAYFISPIETYTKLADRIGNHVYMDELDKFKSFDIDWEEDFIIAESIWKRIIHRETKI